MRLIELIILLAAAFLPPILYAIWIRNTERYHRERWKPIALCFLWGATFAVIAAIILELFLGISITLTLQEGSFVQIIAILFLAPVAEELVKPLALTLPSVHRELTEYEDGLIYGAVAGLGFSATENLLYGWGFWSEGFVFFIIFMIIRSIGGCLLHASATALTGYGYGKTVLSHKSVLRLIPYFIVAVLAHAFYNFLVSWSQIGAIAGLLAALLFAVLLIKYVRGKIRMLDTAHP